MKNILLLAIIGLISSLGAYACPDLSGNYKTSDGSIRKEIQMTRDSAGILTLIDTGGLAIVIDGRPHAIQGPVTYTASCSQAEVTVRFLQGSNELGSMSYSKTASGLHYHSEGMENSDQDLIKF